MCVGAALAPLLREAGCRTSSQEAVHALRKANVGRRRRWRGSVGRWERWGAGGFGRTCGAGARERTRDGQNALSWTKSRSTRRASARDRTASERLKERGGGSREAHTRVHCVSPHAGCAWRVLCETLGYYAGGSGDRDAALSSHANESVTYQKELLSKKNSGAKSAHVVVKIMPLAQDPPNPGPGRSIWLPPTPTPPPAQKHTASNPAAAVISNLQAFSSDAEPLTCRPTSPRL